MPGSSSYSSSGETQATRSASSSSSASSALSQPVSLFKTIEQTRWADRFMELGFYVDLNYSKKSGFKTRNLHKKSTNFKRRMDKVDMQLDRVATLRESYEDHDVLVGANYDAVLDHVREGVDTIRQSVENAPAGDKDAAWSNAYDALEIIKYALAGLEHGGTTKREEIAFSDKSPKGASFSADFERRYLKVATELGQIRRQMLVDSNFEDEAKVAEMLARLDAARKSVDLYAEPEPSLVEELGEKKIEERLKLAKTQAHKELAFQKAFIRGLVGAYMTEEEALEIPDEVTLSLSGSGSASESFAESASQSEEHTPASTSEEGSESSEPGSSSMQGARLRGAAAAGSSSASRVGKSSGSATATQSGSRSTSASAASTTTAGSGSASESLDPESRRKQAKLGKLKAVLKEELKRPPVETGEEAWEIVLGERELFFDTSGDARAELGLGDVAVTLEVVLPSEHLTGRVKEDIKGAARAAAGKHASSLDDLVRKAGASLADAEEGQVVRVLADFNESLDAALEAVHGDAERAIRNAVARQENGTTLLRQARLKTAGRVTKHSVKLGAGVVKAVLSGGLYLPAYVSILSSLKGLAAEAWQQSKGERKLRNALWLAVRDLEADKPGMLAKFKAFKDFQSAAKKRSDDVMTKRSRYRENTWKYSQTLNGLIAKRKELVDLLKNEASKERIHAAYQISANIEVMEGFLEKRYGFLNGMDSSLRSFGYDPDDRTWYQKAREGNVDGAEVARRGKEAAQTTMTAVSAVRSGVDGLLAVL